MTLTVASEVERQLSGRALLVPAMTYIDAPSIGQLEGWRQAVAPGNSVSSPSSRLI
ncbi:hypothetical protein OVA29_08360 [Exiguobacterium sp. SL14]|nr:DUF2487 family protein [Exiguobacterium sp. SL14]MCY1690678.1 hypothetical protein [Exiguobacterium sp. SL14]